MRADCIRDNTLERGAGGARSVGSCSSSTRKTLRRVLATNLWFRPATGHWAGRGERPNPGFFTLLLERRDLYAVRQDKGRLRSYLLTSLRHFLTNERNRTLAIKRGEGQRLIPLEDLRERERVGFEAVDTLAADQIYERRWALALLDEVLAMAYKWHSSCKREPQRCAERVNIGAHMKTIASQN